MKMIAWIITIGDQIANVFWAGSYNTRSSSRVQIYEYIFVTCL
jgi:hypothetical protein